MSFGSNNAFESQQEMCLKVVVQREVESVDG